MMIDNPTLYYAVKRLLCGLCLAGLCVAYLSACAPVIVGGAMVGAAAVSADRRTVGAQTEDATIELKASSRINHALGETVHVNVTSYNGRVLLTGEVHDEATKTRVEEIVKQVENVRSVVNEVQLSAFLSGLQARSLDTLITTKVRAALFNTPDIYSKSYKVITENGVVYLMGRVSEREAEKAVEATRDVSGVKKVVKVFEYIDVKNKASAF